MEVIYLYTYTRMVCSKVLFPILLQSLAFIRFVLLKKRSTTSVYSVSSRISTSYFVTTAYLFWVASIQNRSTCQQSPRPMAKDLQFWRSLPAIELSCQWVTIIGVVDHRHLKSTFPCPQYIHFRPLPCMYFYS